MANTYTLIQSYTVGAGGTSTITFSSIPQTYTDLLLKLNTRMNNASTLGYNTIRFNGDTSSTNYSYRFLDANLGNPNPSSSSATNSPWFINTPAANSTSNVFGNSEIYIPNYASSNYKSGSIDVTGENNSSAGAWLDIIATLYSSTSAITSITINDLFNSASFVQYSAIYLYGISKS